MARYVQKQRVDGELKKIRYNGDTDAGIYEKLDDVRYIEIKKVILPDVKNLYTIFNSTFYYLKENIDDENWELHSLPITPKARALTN